MAKINRFYLLISMLISYKIGTAMAAPAAPILLTTHNTSSNKNIPILTIEDATENYAARDAGASDGEGCYICVPISTSSSNWQKEAQAWVSRNKSSGKLDGVCFANTKEYTNATDSMWSLGTTAKHSVNDYSTTESQTDYLVCGLDGWQVVKYPRQTMHWDTCQDIAGMDECKYYRDDSAADHRLQQAVGLIEDSLGQDMTTPQWQVCMFGESTDFCYGGEEPGSETEEPTITCNSGQYLRSDNTCQTCPYSHIYEAEYVGGNEYEMGAIVKALSKNNNRDNQTSCFIPGSESYMDDSGVYIFTDNCYYG